MLEKNRLCTEIHQASQISSCIKIWRWNNLDSSEIYQCLFAELKKFANQEYILFISDFVGTPYKSEDVRKTKLLESSFRIWLLQVKQVLLECGKRHNLPSTFWVNSSIFYFLPILNEEFGICGFFP